MTEFEFSIVFCENIELTESLENTIYDSPCSDCQLSSVDGRVLLFCDRESRSLADAVFQVLYELKNIGLASEVYCVDPSDLVSQIQIGKRLERTRQQIHQYTSGLRGPGDFPKPIRYTENRKPVWSWSKVLKWFVRSNLMGVDEAAERSASDLAIINGFLINFHNRKVYHNTFSSIEERFHDMTCSLEIDSFSTRIPWDLQGPVDLNVPYDTGTSDAGMWAVGA